MARTFLSLPGWKVRCLTRQPSSEKAQGLVKQGAEVVQADLTDPASLARAFSGVHAIFLDTDFWTTYRSALVSGVDAEAASQLAYDAEVTQGKNAADAAAAVPTLERLVYSALGPMKAASGGEFSHSFHWETKAAIVEHIEKEQPALAAKTSFIYVGAYSSNAHLYPRLQPGSGSGGEETYVMALPAGKNTRFPVINQDLSTGRFVRALVEDEGPGVRLLAYDEYLSFEEFLAIWTRVTGKRVRFVEMTLEQMLKVTGRLIEVLEAPAYLARFGYCAGVPNVIEPAQLKNKVEVQSFEDYLKGRDISELLGR